MVWVRIADWMTMDEEPPRPVAGGVLHSVGLRVHGQVAPAGDMAGDGIAEVLTESAADQDAPVYALTGAATDGRDIWVGDGRRWRSQSQRAGAEFVLTVGGERFQVQHGGLASDVVESSRVTATGGLELVGGYEWEDFGLVDTRADWLVRQVVELPGGNVLVDLHRP